MNTSDYIIIPLSQEQETIIDIIDADLAEVTWTAQKHRSGYYAIRTITDTTNKKRIRIYLHRVILCRILDRELLSKEYADHIDRSSLDNRRRNLRLATPKENSRNRKLVTNNKSGFTGVLWVERYGKWQSQIGVDGKTIWLGYFGDIEDAKKSYEDAARFYFGDFTRFE